MYLILVSCFNIQTLLIGTTSHTVTTLASGTSQSDLVALLLKNKQLLAIANITCRDVISNNSEFVVLLHGRLNMGQVQ
ncbi:hypothetical protein L1987_22018 [Smallanthus sonchifolius]|uniref:Uncharacterized protein n=1 Tax=Smallanthus sonchifolius TaxID=185202 RepID=A0ACB9IF72_9ASTR|nr:hypothetical protein L1987_22018 [Smallanthus sonchifolius]